MTNLAFLYSDKYREHETGQHPENKERLNAILNAIDKEELDSNFIRFDPVPATVEQISLIHPPEYVSMVKDACAQGREYLDGDTMVCADSYHAAILAAGAVITSVDLILEDRVKRSFCAVRPPGHHAERNKAMGFCLFNNIAIGAEYAIKIKGLKKVFIIDWDVHHGNGTQNAFYDRDDIYYLSMHQWPHYPGTGAPEERGEGKGKGRNLNFPLSSGQGDDVYIDIFKDSILPEIENFSPDLIMISAGFDAHELDFLSGMRVSSEGFAKMTELAVCAAEKACQGRIISVLEGGYHLKALGDSVSRHLWKLAGNVD